MCMCTCTTTSAWWPRVKGQRLVSNRTPLKGWYLHRLQQFVYTCPHVCVCVCAHKQKEVGLGQCHVWTALSLTQRSEQGPHVDFICYRNIRREFKVSNAQLTYFDFCVSIIFTTPFTDLKRGEKTSVFDSRQNVFLCLLECRLISNYSNTKKNI